MQPSRETTRETKPQSTIVRSTKKQVPTTVPQDLTPVVLEIEKVLGSLTMLRFKTQSFHWNVEGPSFQSLHKLFEEQYKSLDEQIDLLAERIRAHGFYAPHSLRTLTIESYVDDAVEAKLNWKFMVETLRDDHRRMGKVTKDMAKFVAEEGDTATASLIDDLTLFHEKASWTLNSYLK